MTKVKRAGSATSNAGLKTVWCMGNAKRFIHDMITNNFPWHLELRFYMHNTLLNTYYTISLKTCFF